MSKSEKNQRQKEILMVYKLQCETRYLIYKVDINVCLQNMLL